MVSILRYSSSEMMPWVSILLASDMASYVTGVTLRVDGAAMT